MTQFVKEIQKSPYGDEIRLVSLASRMNTCINPEVKKLGNVNLINERCLDMQKKKKTKEKVDDATENMEVKVKKKRAPKGSGGACQFYKQSNIALLKDQALLQVLDIEELVSEGKRLQGCPYYASRHAVEDAQIVVLPYNTLLHKSTREAIGIGLKKSIVIVDEAHNLLDTISHIHSVEISGSHLIQAHSQLAQYRDRYKSRLMAKNLLYIKQILFVLANLIKVIGGKVGNGMGPDQAISNAPRLIQVTQLMGEAEIYNLNIFKLIKYAKKSKIAQKLHGFMESYQPKTKKPDEKREEKGLAAFLNKVNNAHPISKKAIPPPADLSQEATEAKEQIQRVSSPLIIILEFLQALVNTNSEARILVSSADTLGKSGIKFCLLNPASQFTDLVRECHSIVVAGGTMQPISEFRDQLFASAGAPPERIHHFSCGHVVPKENILPLVLCQGPTGKTLDFTFGNRDKEETLDELHRSLSNISNVTPGGIVCFFPSYDYENRVFSYWTKKGLVEKLEAKKRVFREPKLASQMDAVLKDYSKRAKTTGAILLSVVGGKMSEGINFSDDLGRCVVMVGLPFPNSRSLELKEKMAYLNSTVKALEDGRTAGQVHYENLCMKAVNQSIGRAIRHKGDYASILLLDHRYKRDNIKSQLPGWILKHVAVMEKFGPAIPQVRQFFKSKKEA